MRVSSNIIQIVKPGCSALSVKITGATRTGKSTYYPCRGYFVHGIVVYRKNVSRSIHGKTCKRLVVIIHRSDYAIAGNFAKPETGFFQYDQVSIGVNSTMGRPVKACCGTGAISTASCPAAGK